MHKLFVLDWNTLNHANVNEQMIISIEKEYHQSEFLFWFRFS